MSLKHTIDSLLASAVDSGDVPGVVALATDRERTLYEGAFGRRTLDRDEGMSPDTVAWIASMTKPITSAAAMQLVEQGRLDLDTPAREWVPELGAAQVLDGFDASGAPRTRPPKRPITLRHLLTHTAGYGYPMWNEEVGRYQEFHGLSGTIGGRNASLSLPLLFDPGERWNYGINIEWVGKIVEAASGKRLGQYLRENIFDPLGMRDTGFRITPAMRARLAKIHQRADDGALAATDFEVPQDPEFEVGGGGLYSTAADYLKFMRMILDRGQAGSHRALLPETVDLMSRNHTGELRVTMLRTERPAASNDAEFFPGVPKGWGLGFMINQLAAPTGRSPGSLSWAGLSNCYFWIDPEKGVGGVYITQIMPFADRKSLPLFLDFEAAVYRSLS